MRAQLRSFYSADVEDLASFRPHDGENFGLAITAAIGSADGPGEDTFHFVVCTAQWLGEHPPEKGFSFLRGYLLMTHWDYTVLDRALRDLAAHTEGASWSEVATKLSRYVHWEFEDYRDS